MVAERCAHSNCQMHLTVIQFKPIDVESYDVSSEEADVASDVEPALVREELLQL